MLTLHKTTPIQELAMQAIERTLYGPGVVIGNDAIIYPAIRATFYFDNIVVCRIGDTALWVRHDELEGIHTLDALYVLGRSFDVIITELLLAKPYDFELPEETDELTFSTHNIRP